MVYLVASDILHRIVLTTGKLKYHPMTRATACIILSVLSLLFSTSGLAYMGPTFGLGIIGTVVAILTVLLLSLVAFVVIPIRKMFRKSKNISDDQNSD